MKRYILYLAALAMIVGCSEESGDGDGSSTQTLQNLTIDITTSPWSKVGVAESGDDWSIEWSEEDCLAAWDTWTIDSAPTQFSIATYGAGSSTFEGEILSDVSTMRFFYPYDESIVPASSKLTLSMESQIVGNDISQLSSPAYMISDVVKVSETTTVAMKPICAAIELELNFDPALGVDASLYTLTSLTLGSESSDDGAVSVPIMGELSIASATFTATTSGVMALSTDLAADENGAYSLYMTTFPFAIDIDEHLVVNATFLNIEDQTTQTVEGSIVNSGVEILELAAATKSDLSVLFDEAIGEGVPGNMIVNGDFEDGWKYWNDGVPNVNSSANAPSVVHIDNDENVISGEYSLCLNATTAAAGNGIATQLVKVEVGKTYSYGYTAYVSDDNASAKANMNIQYYKSATTAANINNGDGAEVLTCTTQGEVKVVTGGEITITEANVANSPNKDEIIIFLQKPQGTIYFDDVWFKEK